MSYFGPIGIQANPHAPQKGVTVGGRDADYNGGTEAAIAAAIDALPDEGGVVDLVNGTFRFRSALEITKPNVWIRANPAVQLTPAHAGAVGLFDASADGFGLFGPLLRVETFRNDQALVEISGSRAQVENCTFEVVPTNGSDANPMRLLYLNDAVEPMVARNRFLPNRGVDVIRVLYGHAPMIALNWITNNQDAEFQTNGFAPRLCRSVFDLHHVFNPRIIGNRVWALGVPTFAAGPPLTKCLVYQHEDGITGFPEAGHLEVRGNYFEGIAAPSFLELRGVRWADITGNEFGSSNAEIDGIGDAAIVLLSEDGAGGGVLSNQVQVAGNRFHNVALVEPADGACIYASGVVDLTIQANKFSNMQSAWGIVIDTDAVAQLAIQANKFSPGDTPSTAAIRLLAGTAADYCIQGNTSSGGVPTLSKAGAVSGTLFDNGIMDTSTGNPPGGGASPANLSTNVEL